MGEAGAITEPPPYVATSIRQVSPPLRLVNETFSPAGRLEAIDSNRCAKGPPNTTRGRLALTKTTLTGLFACCTAILAMLWMSLKLYWPDTAPPPPSMSPYIK